MNVMGRISKPTDCKRSNSNFNWDVFILDIIKGNYVLLVGNEAILNGERNGTTDSSMALLRHIVENLKEEGILAKEFSADSFTDFARKTGRSDSNIRKLINDALIGDDISYECSVNDMSDSLVLLLKSRVSLPISLGCMQWLAVTSVPSDNMKQVPTDDNTNAQSRKETVENQFNNYNLGQNKYRKAIINRHLYDNLFHNYVLNDENKLTVDEHFDHRVNEHDRSAKVKCINLVDPLALENFNERFCRAVSGFSNKK